MAKTQPIETPSLKQVLFQRPYGPHLKVEISFDPDEGMTQQQFVESSDINNIMARYVKTDVLDHVKKYEEKYGDTTSLDLHESLNIIKEANEMFADLPSKVRNRFKNDPAEFLDFVQDDANAAEAYELGLTNTKPPIPPDKPAPAAPEPE